MSDATVSNDATAVGLPRPVRSGLPAFGGIRARLLLDLALLASAGLSVAVAARAGASSADMEWQLSLLLRFMAVVKAAMVLAAFGLAHWRLARSVEPAAAVGYIAALAMMGAAPALIWSMSHIALGAGLFHLGLFAFLVSAWRDDAVGAAIAARRPAGSRR